MSVSFADQVLVFLSDPAIQASFPDAIGLSAFTKASFLRRYTQGGFQISNVTLGVPSRFLTQQPLFDETKILGFREKRSESPERHWHELRITRGEMGWVNACFTLPVTLVVQAFPGSLQLGPSGETTLATVSDPEPLSHLLKFHAAVETDTFSLHLNARAFIFVAS